MNFRYFTLLFLFINFSLTAQIFISGKITDTQNTSLAFAAVLPNGDATKATLSDIDGNFSVTLNKTIRSLVFRFVGMQTLILNADSLRNSYGKPVNIKMSFADNKINEVTISAGENLADVLIRNVVANRNKNNPEKLKSFQCETYNKLSVEILTDSLEFFKDSEKKDTTSSSIQNRKKNFDVLHTFTLKQNLFLTETVTEKRFRFPNDNYERVILNRVSGFPDMGMVSLSNDIQPFSFYRDYLTILDKEYVNPISPGSTKRYFFNIEDTLYQNQDTTFIISFHPRKGQVFEALKGVLYINTKNWALQNVRVVPANKLQLPLKIEQQYQFDTVAQQWFPEQLNYEWTFVKPNNSAISLQMVGKSFVSKIKFNLDFKRGDINLETPLVYEKNVFSRNDSIWDNYRKISPLTHKDLKTYQVIDSVVKKNGYGNFAKIMEAANTGKIRLTKNVNLDLAQVFQSNNYEGTRLGIGLTTQPLYPSVQLNRWEFTGNVGYGFKDAAWKYGAGVKFKIDQSSQTNLQLHYKHDLLEAGILNELDNTDLISRSIYARYLDTNDELSVSLNSRLARGLFARLSMNQQDFRPNYNYIFINSDKTSTIGDFHFTESTVYLKYAFDEKVISFFVNDLNVNNRFPVLEIAYTHGFNNFLNGKFNYDKWTLALHQSIPIPIIGRMSWRIEGGEITGNAPLSKLFTLNQGSGFYSVFYVPNTFQSIGDTLLVFDKFLNIYFRQEIGNVFYRTKYSSPKLSLLQNIAIGSFSNAEQHTGIIFRTLSKPLLESGLLLDNIFTFNLLSLANIGFGGGAFYRWGYQTSYNWKQNLQFRLNVGLFL